MPGEREADTCPEEADIAADTARDIRDTSEAAGGVRTRTPPEGEADSAAADTPEADTSRSCTAAVGGEADTPSRTGSAGGADMLADSPEEGEADTGCSCNSCCIRTQRVECLF